MDRSEIPNVHLCSSAMIGGPARPDVRDLVVEGRASKRQHNGWKRSVLEELVKPDFRSRERFVPAVGSVLRAARALFSAMSEMKNGDPTKDIHHPGRRTVVGGYAGSGDYRSNPESSEYRVSQCRPSGAFVHDRVPSSRYKGSPVPEFQEFCS